MITVEEAKKLVEVNFEPLDSEVLALYSASGRVVAEDVASPISMPPFRQSAMDGYALNLQDANQALVLQGVIKAGDTQMPRLNSGHAFRIFTGAMVPDTANVVVMQEKVSVEGNLILIKDENLKPELNIRPLGEQIKEREIALKKGTLLTPGAIGFAASLGISSIRVYRKPSIAVAITGDELVQAGNALLPGQVYESNAITICSAAEQYGYTIAESCFLEDDFIKTKTAIAALTASADVLIITGGISVGDYDFVWRSLQELGCNPLFYKVKQKPGKPLLIGKLGNCSVFALPGNPYAALSCFYHYVLVGLDALSGKRERGLLNLMLPLAHLYTKKGDRAEFLKAKIEKNKVTILGAQASSMLSAFTQANAQVYIPWDINELHEGQLVSCYII